MKKNCGHKKDCGCEDLPLTTPQACPTPGDDCESCVETTCQECVRYCQTSRKYTIEGEDFNFFEGEPLNITLERMFIFLADTPCYKKTAYSLEIKEVECNALYIKWTGLPTYEYVITYEDVERGLSFEQAVPLGATQYRFYNLTPNTEYKFKIKTLPSNCESAEIIVKTKES